MVLRLCATPLSWLQNANDSTKEPHLLPIGHVPVEGLVVDEEGALGDSEAAGDQVEVIQAVEAAGVAGGDDSDEGDADEGDGDEGDEGNCDKGYGDEVVSDEGNGDESDGDEVVGDESVGDEGVGDEMVGDEGVGDERVMIVLVMMVLVMMLMRFCFLMDSYLDMEMVCPGTMPAPRL